MDFDEYQQLTATTDVRPDPTDPAFPLLGLAGEVGSLVAEYKKRLRARDSYEGFAEEVREDLGDLLWYAATLARTVGLSLSDVAAANLAKAAQAFGASLPPPSIYDAEFPSAQRLPRQLTATFVPHEKDGIPHVSMYLGESTVGDPLNDNAYEEDHYRFHDVLHLAHVAVLGWSPLFRALLKAKRKQDPQIDRVEDGARAIFLEEGLVAYVFSEAATLGFFEGSDRVPWDLLKTIRRMTSHLEVQDQPPVAWQAAILQGYAVFRELRRHDGGIVQGDLDARAVRFVSSLPAGRAES